MYSPKKVQDATPEHINASLANVAQAINNLSSQQVVDSSSIYVVKNNGYRIQDASSPPIYVFQMTATAQNLLLPDCSRNIGRTIEVDTVLVGSAPSSYGAVTIKAAGNDTIAGVTSVTLSSPWLRCILFSIGTVWILKEYQDSASNPNDSWVKFAGGTMEQRGWVFQVGNGTTSSATKNVTFPIAFADATYDIVTSTLGYKNSSDPTSSVDCLGGVTESANAHPIDETMFGWHFYSPNSTSAVNRILGSWIAIGKWK